MTNFNQPSTTELKSQYSFFTNEYTLTKEMCAEMELSKMDIGIAFLLLVSIMAILANIQIFLRNPSETLGLFSEYFSSPSPDTVLAMSGFTGIFTGLSVPVAMVFFIKAFPKLLGEKRFNEQLNLVPSENRKVNFYDHYVEVKGKFSKKLPYNELQRTGETRNLYLLFFTERRILLLPKNRFCKGTLAEVKAFVRERRTLNSKIYGVVRWLPVVLCNLLFIWTFCADL